MKAFLLAAGGLLIFCTAQGQTQALSEMDRALTLGTVANMTVWDAIENHKIRNVDFRVVKQEPAFSNTPPPVLVHKNGTLNIDWTPGQHVRYLMESLRQGLHTLRAVQKPNGLDLAAIHSGRDAWPKLRDAACKDEPGLKYWDLDGIAYFCPE